MKPEEEKIRELQNELEELRINFQEFIYTISHDLSAPIRTIVAFSELLQKQAESTLDEKSQHYLSFIISGGEKAQTMLAGLLDYSRLNTRPKKPALADIGMIVANCVEALQSKIVESNALIQVDELPVIHADEEQMYQLFYSLIDNSLKFHSPAKSGDNPVIKIRAERSEEENKGSWRFWVEDNGIGIESRYAEEIFSVFRRLHRETEYPGIGMGLALAKKIVELHHGVIGVSSLPGQGSAFYFILPDIQVDSTPQEAIYKISHLG